MIPNLELWLLIIKDCLKDENVYEALDILEHLLKQVKGEHNV